MISSNSIRKKILEIVVSSSEGHVASSFSIVEILIAIYDDMLLKRGSYEPDSIVLSKGHASYAYYAFLNALGLMSSQEMAIVGQSGSKFYGHLPHINGDDRFFYGSGSLGHGLPFSLGLAVANEISGDNRETYCIVGDGEANEGTFWETLLLADKFNSSRLNILVDCNGSSERAIPIVSKLKNLGLLFSNIDVRECDGHNLIEISDALSSNFRKVKLILCNTVKGYPCSMMMNNPIWHHRIPNDAEMSFMLEDLK